MASKVKNNKVNFKGKTVSVGIDMHKISWRITALAGWVKVFHLVNLKNTKSYFWGISWSPESIK